MAPSDVLTLADGVELHEPVLLVALTGWFDVASAATTALDTLIVGAAAETGGPVTVGEIDPDRFYDFTVERPMVELDEGLSVLVWPQNEFRAARTGAAHDVVALSGVEPHLAWATYVDCIVGTVQQLGVGLVVTLGATADTTPHTRMPLVVASSSSPQLARRLGLSAPAYQGVTGVIGVLHSELEAAGVRSISLRVGVPHYLAAGEHPRAVASLVGHVAHVIDVPLTADLGSQIAHWDDQHTATIADDDQMRAYVRMLEADYDQRAEASLANGDELAAQFERFLRERPDDERR